MIRRAIPGFLAAGFALPVPSPLSEEPPPPKAPAVIVTAEEFTPLRLPDKPAPEPPKGKRLATIVHGHTQETLELTEIEPSVERFSAFLADRGYERETRMDPRLIDLLRAIAKRHEGARIEILSGYRSPKRNELMRKKGRHVASHSQHTLGGAIDFRIDGISTGKLAGEILQLKWEGGLGIYAGRRDRFVHVDTGPKRRWSGF